VILAHSFDHRYSHHALTGLDPNYTFVSKIDKRYLPDRPRYGGTHRRLREQGVAYLRSR